MKLMCKRGYEIHQLVTSFQIIPEVRPVSLIHSYLLINEFIDIIFMNIGDNSWLTYQKSALTSNFNSLLGTASG